MNLPTSNSRMNSNAEFLLEWFDGLAIFTKQQSATVRWEFEVPEQSLKTSFHKNHDWPPSDPTDSFVPVDDELVDELLFDVSASLELRCLNETVFLSFPYENKNFLIKLRGHTVVDEQ